MRMKSRGTIVSLLYKAGYFIAAIVIRFTKAFANGMTKKGIETQTANAKREKVYCRTNSMAAVKWASKKNLSYITKANTNLSKTKSGQIQGYAVFKGG